MERQAIELITLTEYGTFLANVAGIFGCAILVIGMLILSIAIMCAIGYLCGMQEEKPFYLKGR